MRIITFGRFVESLIVAYIIGILAAWGVFLLMETGLVRLNWSIEQDFLSATASLPAAALGFFSWFILRQRGKLAAIDRLWSPLYLIARQMHISLSHVPQMVTFPLLGGMGVLLVGMLPMPYGYYTLLRLCIAAVMISIGFQALQAKVMWLFWTVVFVGLIYNPLVPFHFGRTVWVLVNIVTISFLLFLWIGARRASTVNNNSPTPS